MKPVSRALVVTWSSALALFASCQSPQSSARKEESEPNDEACFVLIEYEAPPNEPIQPRRHLIAAGWANGKVVWQTGPPKGLQETLATAEIEPERVQQLARELFDSLSEWDDKAFIAPHSGCHMLVVWHGERSITVATCHEAVERNADLVCINGGVAALDDRSRDDVLASESTPYWLAFRQAWASMRDGISAVVDRASQRDPESCVLEYSIASLQFPSGLGESTEFHDGSEGRATRLVDCKTGEEAALVVYDDCGFGGSDARKAPARQLIAAVWSNGRVVRRMGPPSGMNERLSSTIVDPKLVQECVRDMIEAMSEWEHAGVGAGLHGCYRGLVAIEGDRRVALTVRGNPEEQSKVDQLDLATVPASVQQFVRTERAYRLAWREMQARINRLVEAAPGSDGGETPVERACWGTR